MTNAIHAERFAALFKGYSKAFGTYDARTLGGNGKQKPQYLSVKKSPNISNFVGHLLGKKPIGIYVLDDNDKVSFAAIDIDEYPIDHSGIASKLNSWGLPLVVCNSKSGGAHLYVFFSQQEDPSAVVSVLESIATALGYSGTEIFPKQTARDKPNSLGNFINLPFFGNPMLSYNCWDREDQLHLEGFLALAEANLTTISELEQAIHDAGIMKSISDHSVQDNNPASGRNDFLFKYGCELRRLVSDDKTVALQIRDKNKSASSDDHPNFSSMGPLSSSEVEKVIESVLKQDIQSGSVKLGEMVSDMNQHHAHVMIGGKAKIINIKHDPIHGWSTHDFSSPADFRSCYSNKQIKVGDKMKSIGQAWLDHPDRLSYQGVTFDPDYKDSSYYNLFQGFAVEPNDGDCGLYLEHIRCNICKGDEDLYHYVLDWMADAIQNPSKRPGVALAIKGKQGVGKGVFASTFLSLFGPHGIQVTQSSHLVGNFNAHLRDKLLVFADEAFWAGDKKSEGVLKALITEDTLAIEMKGVDVQTSPNFTRLILASNNEWLIPASADQRRFVVLEAGVARQQDSAYFKAIADQMENGGRQALMKFLMDRDLYGINLRNIPKTSALTDQLLYSLDSVGQWLYTCLDYEGYQEGLGNTIELKEWPKSIRTDNLRNAYLNYCNQNSVNYKLSSAVFGKRLKELLPSIKKQRMKKGNIREMLYILPELEHAKEQFIEVNKLYGLVWSDQEELPLRQVS
jgi:hypothetical protein